MEKKEHFGKVFEVIGGLQQVHSKGQLDLNNIESVFTALELGRIIQKVPGLEPEEIRDRIVSLKELIVTTIESTMLFPIVEGTIQPTAPHAAFSKLISHITRDAERPESVSIITFNYDIGVDIALTRSGFVPHYGLSVEAPENSSIDLLKLHGSLNWSSEDGSGDILSFSILKYLNLDWTFYGSPINLLIGTNLQKHFLDYEKKGVRAEPLIVPPSWNKSDYHSSLTSVWAKAALHLSEAKNIFIIGYSLPETDSFFRHLYALGSVGKSPLKRIAVFDPDPTGSVDGRFRNLLGPGALSRYEYIQSNFTGAIGQIQGWFASKKY
jgi:hypothetical protein